MRGFLALGVRNSILKKLIFRKFDFLDQADFITDNKFLIFSSIPRLPTLLGTP